MSILQMRNEPQRLTFPKLHTQASDSLLFKVKSGFQNLRFPLDNTLFPDQ